MENSTTQKWRFNRSIPITIVAVFIAWGGGLVGEAYASKAKVEALASRVLIVEKNIHDLSTQIQNVRLLEQAIINIERSLARIERHQEKIQDRLNGAE